MIKETHMAHDPFLLRKLAYRRGGAHDEGGFNEVQIYKSISNRPIFTRLVAYRLSKEVVQRSFFEKEVDIAKSMGQAQIAPRLFSWGIHENGRGYMIMEAFDTNFLNFTIQTQFKHLVKIHRDNLMTQVVNLLSLCIFEMSIFNSDIKPANIVVRIGTSLPVMRIIDFDPFFAQEIFVELSMERHL